MQFPRQKAADDVLLVIESSPDLVTWVELSPSATQDNFDGTETVTATTLLGDNDRQFLRLRATLR